eukprot:superscaffoldBa00005769_g20759
MSSSASLPALGSEIINGENVPKNSMLYMASVQNDRDSHVCGGFLINKEFVVTAAHCDDSNPTSVVLGTHDLNNVNNTMRYRVKRFKHPSYCNIESGNDIMLLKLSEKARVEPIKLPKTKMKIKDKEKCRVAGWGQTGTGKGDAVHLQMVDVPIINLKGCKKKWAPFKLPANVICAGGDDTKKGFCQGDSGGPLVCGKVAVGVVSFNNNENCKYPDVPNVYTDISKYLDWIKKILKKKNC